MHRSIPASATSDAVSLAGVSEPARRVPLLRRFLRTPAGVVGASLLAIVAIMAALAGQIAPADPFATVDLPLRPPSAAHPMGTDDLGRDVLSGVVHGARTSMIVVLSVVGIAAAIGISIGSVAGYRGGAFDQALLRVIELFQTIPRFFLAITVVALFGPGIWKLVIVLALTSWDDLARVVRAESLSVSRREFVEAARSLGASHLRILTRHVVPNVVHSAVVVISLTAAMIILLEATLAFIGLGDPSVMSWGYLANNAQRFLRVAWWMALFPGLAILGAVLGLNLLGDALNDLLNPLAGTDRLFPARSGAPGRRDSPESS